MPVVDWQLVINFWYPAELNQHGGWGEGIWELLQTKREHLRERSVCDSVGFPSAIGAPGVACQVSFRIWTWLLSSFEALGNSLYLRVKVTVLGEPWSLLWVSIPGSCARHSAYWNRYFTPLVHFLGCTTDFQALAVQIHETDLKETLSWALGFKLDS